MSVRSFLKWLISVKSEINFQLLNKLSIAINKYTCQIGNASLTIIKTVCTCHN